MSKILFDWRYEVEMQTFARDSGVVNQSRRASTSFVGCPVLSRARASLWSILNATRYVCIFLALINLEVVADSC